MPIIKTTDGQEFELSKLSITRKVASGDCFVLTPVVKEEPKPEKKGLWKPGRTDGYYFIHATGVVESNNVIMRREESNWRGFIEERASIGNIFRTESEAIKKLEWLKAVMRLKEYIAINELDYDDYADDFSYVVGMDAYDTTILHAIKQKGSLVCSPIGYLKSEEACNQLIRDCEKDLKIMLQI